MCSDAEKRVSGQSLIYYIIFVINADDTGLREVPRRMRVAGENDPQWLGPRAVRTFVGI